MRNTTSDLTDTRRTLCHSRFLAADSRRAAVTRSAGERGSVLVLVTLSLLTLVGVVGLALDAGVLYVAKQRAQAAADAAAQAAAMDIYNATGGDNGASIARWYAQQNGFSASEVTVSYPSCADLSWCSGHVTLSSGTPNLVEVKIQRTVNTILMRVVGIASSTVSAVADGAIALAPSPLPIALIHPTLSGALSLGGTAEVQICGGPARAFQVNSTSPTSISASSNTNVDVSKAGPLDPGDCSSGTGADFANASSQTPYPGTIQLGTKPGAYIPNASAIADPLLTVNPPATQPAAAAATVTCGNTTCSDGKTPAQHSCPTSCTIYSPGYYANGITLNGFSVFRPGLYWINHGGLNAGSNTILRMAQAAIDQTDPATGTGWTTSMLIYNNPAAPASGTADILSISANSGKLQGNSTYPTTDCPNGGNCLNGTPSASAYKGILFFQSRTAVPSSGSYFDHQLQGGSGWSVRGTIYMTHTASSIAGDGKYNRLSLQGGACGSTVVQGEIITDAINVGGNGCIRMNLIQTPVFTVREVALVR